MRYSAKVITVLITFFACFPLQGVTQSNPNGKREKIYIQIDKPFYKQKDVIRFNLTVLDAATHVPSFMSDVVYAELVDPRGTILKKLTLPILEGTAKGDFDLPDIGGMYTLQAYTSWSKNFEDIELLERQIPVQNMITTRLLLKLDFEKENYAPGDVVSFDIEVRDLKDQLAVSAAVNYQVRISGEHTHQDSLITDSSGVASIRFPLPSDLNTTDVIVTAVVDYDGVEESVTRSVPIVLNAIELKFYPEGGHPVIGEESIMAFEGVNEYGKGADLQGVIWDDQGAMIAEFQSLHDGMGLFSITYEAERTYTAQITSPSVQKDFTLPEAQAVPVLVLAHQSKEDIVFKVLGSGDGFKIEGFNRGQLIFESVCGHEIRILNRSLPTGINRFVLKNAAGLPLSERMVFVNKDLTMKVDVHSEKDQYTPGDLVTLKVQTSDPQGQPSPMKVGLAVVDDQLIAMADDKSDHILSYFYVSSELKGEVNDPKYYFDPREEHADAALDLLMMIRGWSRYSWDQPDSACILYLPEKIRLVSGQLVDKNGQPVEGYVYALERSEKQRMIKVKTTPNGYFTIKNFDAGSALHVFTKKPNKLIVDDDRAMIPVNRRPDRFWYGLDVYDDIYINDIEIIETNDRSDALEPDSFSGELNLSLAQDISSLDEIVVVGYGEVTRKELTGSIVTIDRDQIESFPTMNALQGKVAGIVITTPSVALAVPSNISFSRAKSLAAGDGSPLVVLDGFALSPSNSKHFMNSDIFTPDQVQSISYMDSPDARLQFGAKAGNGIVFVEGKSAVSSASYRYETQQGKYNGVVITSRNFSMVRDVYELPQRKRTAENSSRKQVDHLVYWNPEIVTDENGQAEVSFYANDQVSNFRVTAEGISTDGQLGRGESTYFTGQSLSMDVKLPNQIGYEDKITARVMIANETNESLEGLLEVTSDGLSVVYDQAILLNPHSQMTVPIAISPSGIAGQRQIRFGLRAGKYSDELLKTLTVFPIGFPTTISHSGANPNGKFRFKITNAESGTIRTNLVVYPSVVSDLESSTKSLFKEPHGCFEQVSSTTYPSILALRYLNSTGAGTASSRATALEYIASGYKKLVAYEIGGGGFEWFGHKPAHEGLTAFGLVEFNQMKNVFDGVEEDMIKRSIDWLLSRRDGRGGFDQNAGKHGFSAASPVVNNAYIVYALSEIGISDIDPEYQQSLAEAIESQDHYRLALMANAAWSLKESDTYKKLVGDFVQAIHDNGFQGVKADHSLVRSYGANLKNEVLSLWALALLKDHATDIVFVSRIIEYLLDHRTGAHFGSTQATALTLQAITEYNLQISSKNLSGVIELWINHVKRKELTYFSSLTDPLEYRDFSEFFHESEENLIELKYPDKEAKLPYSIVIQWMDTTPRANDSVSVHLHSGLSDVSVQVNETVRMVNTLENKKDTGLPMTMVRLGIPGGLSLQTWQLKELQEKRLFDYYEIINDDLVLYFKELAPNQVIDIPLDLKAEIPGEYTGRASCAYLYYNDDKKFWVPGVRVKVEQ